jgi:uncharacterized sulfatase
MYGLCTMRAVVGKRFKYVHYPYDTGELYDMTRDPWEIRNLIDDPERRSTVRALAGQLKTLMNEASDNKVRIL